MTALSDEQRQAAQRAGLPDPGLQSSNVPITEREWAEARRAGLDYEGAKRAKAQRLAKERGITVAQVEFVFRTGGNLDEHAAMAGVHTIDEYQAVRAQVLRERRAEEKAAELAALEAAQQRRRTAS